MNENINFRIGSYGHMYSRALDVKTYSNIDILFLGSSHAYRGFDTRIFRKNGLTSFNLGSSSQTPIQTEILANRYLRKLNPRIVIYEVFPWTFESDGVESALDLIANDRIDFKTVMMAFKLNHIKVYNTLFYGIFRRLFMLDNNFIERKKKGDDVYITGGYVEKKISFFSKCDDCTPKVWIPKKYQVNAFKRVVNLIRNKGIEIILVQAPVTKELYNSIENKSEVDNFFQSFNLRYFNFNELLKLQSNKFFYDSNHMNQNGVAIFNKRLLSIFHKDKLL